MRIAEIEPGSRVFVDASIFIYHFTGVSRQCRDFLARCERADVVGVTSTVVIAEVAHRLMMMEAVSRGFVSAGNVVRKLREKPSLIRKLSVFEESVARIPLMGISVIPVAISTLFESSLWRRETGLLVDDSLVAEGANEARANGIASADRDFRRVKAFPVYRPTDLT